MRWMYLVTDGYLAYCIGNRLENVVLVAHANNGTTCWKCSAGINVWGVGTGRARWLQLGNIDARVFFWQWILKIDIWEALILLCTGNSFSPVPFMGRLRAYRFHSVTQSAFRWFQHGLIHHRAMLGLNSSTMWWLPWHVLLLDIGLCIKMICWTWTCLTGNYAVKLLDIHLAQIGV